MRQKDAKKRAEKKESKIKKEKEKKEKDEKKKQHAAEKAEKQAKKKEASATKDKDVGPQNHRNHSANKQRAQSGQKQKKQLFEPYWPEDNISDGLKRGELISGAIRINPRNYEDAYVPHPNGQMDIYISGLYDRNRALNGDEVAILIKPRDQWKVLTENLKAKEDITASLNKLSIKPDTASAPSHTKSKENELVETENSLKPNEEPKPRNTGDFTPNKTPNSHVKSQERPQSSQKKSRYITLGDYSRGDNPVAKRLFQEGATPGPVLMDVPDSCLQPTARVVFILERWHSRASTGNIKPMQDKNPNFALFVPIDHRVPRIMIPMADCPHKFLERPEDHCNTLFIARITDWDETSNYPRGNLARSLGEAGQIEPETEGMLIENDIDYSEFSQKAIDCLPIKTLPWKIPESELKERRDFRDECVFTIDPATARDLDDAMHCKHLGDGLYEIGVHIADVSYFLEEGTELDNVAGRRATSVYLVQKVIPMLPRILCEELCSLNPAEDRLTFSVVWKMTEEGEILDEWFGRSVICSCVKMAYDHAQGFIENPDRDWTREELPPILEKFKVKEIKEKVLNLDKIAKQLRKQRFDQGALRLDQVKLSYALDKETGMPCGYSVYQQKDSNKLIEEFMLLANMAVAHRISKMFPEKALLRRHAAPQGKMMEELADVCSNMGVPIDASSSATLHTSLLKYVGPDVYSQARSQILTVLCSKPMQMAKYFCTGCLEEEALWRHYALSVPRYTHFTSPIRRYADVIVHRLLAASLDYQAEPNKTKEEIHKQADRCNDRKTASKRVQELSSDMFFAIFVKESGPLEEHGMVMGVLDKAFDVVMLRLGVVKRVYCEKLGLSDWKFQKDHKKPVLTLTWPADEQHPNELKQEITIFSLVNCVLEADKLPLKWTALITRPTLQE
ncbi:unnamed protein product [Owenia fusiformis]|uniref:DIS3-like exonuclease 2 n=1 Tax=Owenia fusiformis TaxID=6347 RepID=A0A8S4N2B9_OWEFU|nr:unnamed protein product [Owenia fusiformis]